MQDTPRSQPREANAYLVRCPSCHEWFEEADLVRTAEEHDGPTIYRCPRDSTVLEPPALRPPPPPPWTGSDKAMFGCLFVPYLVFMPGWAFVGLPLLAGAAFVLWGTGNATLLVVWAVVTVVWLVLAKVIGLTLNN
jgi:hypothetical protein